MKINKRLSFTIINKIKNDDILNNYLKEISKGYLLKYTYFAFYKDKANEKSQELYKNILNYGENDYKFVYNFIYSTILSIRFLENYIISLDDNVA